MTESFKFISAGAGSGKTYRLTELLHEMLVDGRVRPSGILATTFTNRAAAELRERVRSHLIGKRQFALATEIGQARIGTVNSVCGALLGRFAFEAGMPTEQHVLDEYRAQMLLSASIDEVIEGTTLKTLLVVAGRLGLADVAYGGTEIPWKAALSAIVSQARSNAIEPASLRALGDWNADELLAYFPAATDRDLDAQLLNAIDTALPPIRAAVQTKVVKKTAEYLRLIESARDALRSDGMSWSQWNKLSREEPEAGLRTTAQPVADAAAAHSSHPRLHADLRGYLSTIFSLAADVLERYQERKRLLGAIDFVDQESELLKILDDPFVAETFKEELDLLMVDEFQDTSPIQLALFLKLARFARHVVWVGDVKQAIYGFRGGDAALMSAVLERLPDLGASKEVLKFSWRSRPTLVQLANDVFGRAFSGMLPQDVQLEPKRAEETLSAAVEDWQLGGNAASQRQGIADGIIALVDARTPIVDPRTKQVRPVRLGDIAVLARSNQAVTEIARTLQSRRVTASTQQPGLMRRPEIVLAMACLRRLNDERDTIATAEIVSLADCEDPDTWVVDRLQWLAQGRAPHEWKDDPESAHPILAAIRALRAQRALLSPLEAVQLVIARCDLSRRVLQWRPSTERARLRLTNLNRLIEVASEYESECGTAREAATLSGFLLWVADLEESGLDLLPQPDIDAVQVMTHHASKGLEWPVVVLVDLAGDVKDSIWDAVRAESREAIDVDAPLRDRVLRYWPWPYGGQSKAAVADQVEASGRGRDAMAAAVEEHKRLLYVSMTRARDVVVFARAAKKLDGPWMQTVGLADVLAGDGDTLALSGGTTISVVRRDVTNPSEGDARPGVADELWWFELPGTSTERPPLTVSPSAADAVPAKVVDTVRVGDRIDVAPGVEPATLGEAVHACLAARFVAGSAPFAEQEVEAILSRMGANGAVAPGRLSGQVAAVRDWVLRKWPGADALVEVPVSRTLVNGQQLAGRVDLLLRTEDGWILIDYKSGDQGAAQWESLARGYSGQLHAYRKAIESVTGVTVLESWLVLPIAGVAFRVECEAAVAQAG